MATAFLSGWWNGCQRRAPRSAQTNESPNSKLRKRGGRKRAPQFCDERFSPVAERAIAIWKQLRLQSNVDLGGIELEGTAKRRRVTLRVTVDGTPAEALGVMSQGELHGVALSLFLPRATLPESPFRFLMD